MNIELLTGALELGGIYAVMALGVYITYKILDFPDLTVDGSFPLGAAVTATLITSGASPVIASLLSLIAGALAGFLTGLLHVKLKIRDLLSGIIMMTSLYSVNLVIAGNNLPMPRSRFDTLFSNAAVTKLFGDKSTRGIFDFARPFKTVAVLLIILVFLKLLTDFLLDTKAGYLLKASGTNPAFVASMGKNCGNIKLFGLSAANALVSFSGSLYCQHEGVFNISDGTGKMVIGLASVIIGVNLFGRIKKVRGTSSVILGAVVYTVCITAALKNFEPYVTKLASALLFLAVLLISKIGRYGKERTVKK